MSDLAPVAFDIETSGFDEDAVITVAGFAHDLGASLICNTGGRELPDQTELATALDRECTGTVQLQCVAGETELLDLVGVYETLIGESTCDPFEESGTAVTAFENEDWLPLLKHNLADIQRTGELATLAERFVPKSDFKMKNLAPPAE